MNVHKTGDQTEMAHCTRPTPYHTRGGSSATFPSFKCVQEMLLQHTYAELYGACYALGSEHFDLNHGVLMEHIRFSGMKVFPK